jgi:hypothetical protein
MLLVVTYQTLDEMRRYAAAGNQKAIRELADYEQLSRAATGDDRRTDS